VNHYGLNLYSRHGKLIATAPQVYGLFMLDRIFDRPLESTEYTDIDDSCLLALQMTGYVSRHDGEKRMFGQCRGAHIGFMALEIFPKVIADAASMTLKCDYESCIKCKLA
jgi:hypothetical protein